MLLYKKVLYTGEKSGDWWTWSWRWAIATLEVPDGATVIAPHNTRKRRVAAAVVREIEVITATPFAIAATVAAARATSQTPSYHSWYNGMEYRVGETVSANLDTNPDHDCGTGIHCFLTREEAENYWF